MKTRAFTSSSAASWTPLPSDKQQGVVHAVTVVNRTGADLTVAYTNDTGDSDAGVTLTDNDSVFMRVNQNISEVSTKGGGVAPGVEFVFDES